MCFYSTFCCWPSALHAWPSQHGVQQKNDPLGSASPPQVAQSFHQASVSSCPSWVNTKRIRVEGENMSRWSGVLRAVCVHTQVSQSQETHYCCQALPNIISRRFLLGWFWSINSDLRSCSKTHQEKTLFFRPWWPLSPLASLVYLDDVFSVSCHQISMTRPEEKRRSIKLESKQGDDKRKRWFFAMKNLKNNWSKEIRQYQQLEEQKVQRQKLKNIFFCKKKHQDLFVQKRAQKREMAWYNTCPAAEINDNWMPHAIVDACEYRNNVCCKNQFLFLKEIKW